MIGNDFDKCWKVFLSLIHPSDVPFATKYLEQRLSNMDGGELSVDVLAGLFLQGLASSDNVGDVAGDVDKALCYVEKFRLDPRLQKWVLTFPTRYELMSACGRHIRKVRPVVDLAQQQAWKNEKKGVDGGINSDSNSKVEITQALTTISKYSKIAETIFREYLSAFADAQSKRQHQQHEQEGIGDGHHGTQGEGGEAIVEATDGWYTYNRHEASLIINRMVC